MKLKVNFLYFRRLRLVAYAALTFLFGFLLYSQRADLSQAWHASRGISAVWMLAGCAAMAVSVVCTAAIYSLLTPNKLQFGRLMAVQTSGLFVNKLLPSGSGAAGVSFLFLRAHRVPAARAGIIVVLNNTLGFCGHAVLVACVLLAFHSSGVAPASLQHIVPKIQPAYVVGAGVCIAIMLGIMANYRVARLTRRTVNELRSLIVRPGVLLALIVSMLLTSCYVAALYAAGRAAGIDVNLVETLIVLTLSVGATALVPSPGGVGAAEAGVFLGLRAFNVDGPTAVLVALLYRLITFWVPLGVGAGAMIFVEKQGLLRPKRKMYNM